VRVIDSSALIKYFSREKGWEDVRRYMLEGVLTIDLAIKETLNALWRKIIKEEIMYETVVKLIKDLTENRPFPLESQEQYLTDAFEIAVNNHITIYDALFIAVAKRRNLELITSDKKQADIAERLGVKTILV
jgi:predicted nucleic acid-binding protein